MPQCVWASVSDNNAESVNAPTDNWPQSGPTERPEWRSEREEKVAFQA